MLCCQTAVSPGLPVQKNQVKLPLGDELAQLGLLMATEPASATVMATPVAATGCQREFLRFFGNNFMGSPPYLYKDYR